MMTVQPPTHPHFLLQIYTIHVNYLFQGENSEFRRKVTSLHPWMESMHEVEKKIKAVV